MKESRVKLESECAVDQYRAWYRCTNCGTIFQFDMPIGESVGQMRGQCPLCFVKSGPANVGTFPIIKYNPEYDQIQRHYFK